MSKAFLKSRKSRSPGIFFAAVLYNTIEESNIFYNKSAFKKAGLSWLTIFGILAIAIALAAIL